MGEGFILACQLSFTHPKLRIPPWKFQHSYSNPQLISCLANDPEFDETARLLVKAEDGRADSRGEQLKLSRSAPSISKNSGRAAEPCPNRRKK